MAYAAGLSEHPITAAAVGEVAGQVLEGLGAGRPPDLAVLFVTAPHAGALEDAARAVRTVLRPGALVGCAAETVVGGDREVEEQAAVSLWAGHTGSVAPFHLRLETTPDGDTLVGWPDPVPATPSALLLLADPFSFPADAFLSRAGDDFPHLPVVGGMASAARGPGGNRLVLDDRVVDHGAVGAFLGPDVGVATVVSQGCRPVGDPYAVTKAERNIVYELAGRPGRGPQLPAWFHCVGGAARPAGGVAVTGAARAGNDRRCRRGQRWRHGSGGDARTRAGCDPARVPSARRERRTRAPSRTRTRS